MLPRDFSPDDVFVKCRKCNEAHPKSDFPTIHRVCIDCAHSMNWRLPERRGRRPATH